MPKGRQGEFAKAGKGGFEDGSVTNAPRASGGKGSQLSAIVGFLRIFGAGTSGTGQSNVWQRNAG